MAARSTAKITAHWMITLPMLYALNRVQVAAASSPPGLNQHPDHQDDAFHDHEANAPVPPRADSDVRVGRVDELLAPVGDPVPHDGEGEEEAAEHEPHAPDPVLVLEDLHVQSRRNAAQETGDAHHGYGPVPVQPQVHQDAAGQLDHGHEAAPGGEHQGQEEKDHEEPAAGHLGEELGKSR